MAEDTPPVAIVTGASGGVGRAVVALLTARGVRVVAEDISDSVHDLGSPLVVPLRADAALSASARQAVLLARDRFGRLDILINNAARFLRKSATETSDDEWDSLMALNLRGPFVHVREAIPLLLESHGVIVNTASTSGILGSPDQAAYAASKGALIQLTRQLAVELGPRGVRVNAVAAGAIDTAFAAQYPRDPDLEKATRSIRERYPIGRISSPEEIAEAICFLASPASASTTGAILPVDGGYSAR